MSVKSTIVGFEIQHEQWECVSNLRNKVSANEGGPPTAFMEDFTEIFSICVAFACACSNCQFDKKQMCTGCICVVNEWGPVKYESLVRDNQSNVLRLPPVSSRRTHPSFPQYFTNFTLAHIRLRIAGVPQYVIVCNHCCGLCGQSLLVTLS